MKPRILFVIDRPGWAYDICAQRLAQHLGDRFDFRFLYIIEKPTFDPEDYDIVYVFWWGESYHQQFGVPREKIIKEISSHRWEWEPKYGLLTPQQTATRYLHDAGTVIPTSQRLWDAFQPYIQQLHYCPNGYDPEVFRSTGPRSGKLRIGWAGNVNDPKKKIIEIIRPACAGRFELVEAGGKLTRDEMANFYDDIDVIAIAATEEGTPLPLLEGMAGGAFPVSTDVGVVPEVVEHEKNGLIVPRTLEAFRDAFAWCEENLQHVRAAGEENAQAIPELRSWPVVAEQWVPVLEGVLDRVPRSERSTIAISITPQENDSQPATPEEHPSSSFPEVGSHTPEPPSTELFQARLLPLLADSSDILVLTAGDASPDLPDLPGHPTLRLPGQTLPADSCDTILIWAALDAWPRESIPELLQACRRTLRRGGKLIVLAANAEVLESGDWSADSLKESLVQEQFCRARIHTDQRRPAALKRRVRRLAARLTGSTSPRVAGRWVVVSAHRPASIL